MARTYNIWLTIEPVEIDEETGEELDWPDDLDMFHAEGKLAGGLTKEEAEDFCNSLLEDNGSPMTVEIVTIEEED